MTYDEARELSVRSQAGASKCIGICYLKQQITQQMMLIRRQTLVCSQHQLRMATNVDVCTAFTAAGANRAVFARPTSRMTNCFHIKYWES